MKAVELRKKTEDELKSELSAAMRKQLKLRLLKGSGDDELNKTHDFKTLRRDIARILTVLKEKDNK